MLVLSNTLMERKESAFCIVCISVQDSEDMFLCNELYLDWMC